MDNLKVGEYLQALRKTKGITQSELADILNVSSKTVSKWECGTSLPEIPMLKIISEYYGVLVDDILNGDKIEKENIKEISEKTKEANYEYFYQRDVHKFRMWKMLSFLCLGISIFGTIGFSLIGYSADRTDPNYIYVLPLAFFMLSIFISIMSFFGCLRMNENKQINQYTKMFSRERILYEINFSLLFVFWFIIGVINVSVLSYWAF